MIKFLKKGKVLAFWAGLSALLGLCLTGCDTGGDAQGNGVAGHYSGTWVDAGDATHTGTWSFTVGGNWLLTGVVTEDGFDQAGLAAEGRMEADGAFIFETTGAVSLTMTGVIQAGQNGNTVGSIAFSGDWTATGTGGTSVRFAVISDPHYYDTYLGDSGTAFETYLAGDRKLLRESSAILESAVDGILAQKPQFVIVAGDLTKDGERVCHEKFALAMGKLEDSGIDVYVVPGNHDINNPHAYAFNGDTRTPVPTVTAEEFAQIYADFGFEQAIDRDTDSLSYLVEPVAGVWLLALDSCLYDENQTAGHPVTGGAFSDTTLTWINEKLTQARTEGKMVMAVMHHGLVEHYTAQSVFFPDYVIQNWTTIYPQLAQAGLPLVFTGHYHSHDITYMDTNVSGDAAQAAEYPFVFDVETGSLVTYPCPYRVVSLSPSTKEAVVRSYRVQHIDYDTGGDDFQDYAYHYVANGLLPQVYYMLTTELGIPDAKAAAVAPDGVEAMLAHYAGDETPSQEVLVKIQQYSQDPDLVAAAGLMSYFWTDHHPEDNDLTINLVDGQDSN